MTTRTDDLPRFVYGTAWKEQDTERLTRLALECGFRAIDTANQRRHYYESGVGEAIADAIDSGLVERDDLFMQTKFTFASSQDHRTPYDVDASHTRQVEQSFESSLDHLGIETIDSYVLHGPSSRSGLTDADREVWRAMEGLLASGRVEQIGVSNVSPEQFEALIDWADHPPSAVQNRCFARTGWGMRTREICDARDITYQGFSLLTANERALRSTPIQSIADRHDRTIPQIVFRFALQLGITPLTGTTSEEHMHDDLDVFHFELDADEVKTIETIALE